MSNEAEGIEYGGVRQFCAKVAKQHFFEPSNLHRDD